MQLTNIVCITRNLDALESTNISDFIRICGKESGKTLLSQSQGTFIIGKKKGI